MDEKRFSGLVKRITASGYSGKTAVDFIWRGKKGYAKVGYETSSDKRIIWIEYIASLPDGRVVKIEDNNLTGNYGQYKEKELTDAICNAIYEVI